MPIVAASGVGDNCGIDAQWLRVRLSVEFATNR
jgi:hypothetical protein